MVETFGNQFYGKSLSLRQIPIMKVRSLTVRTLSEPKSLQSRGDPKFNVCFKPILTQKSIFHSKIHILVLTYKLNNFLVWMLQCTKSPFLVHLIMKTLKTTLKHEIEYLLHFLKSSDCSNNLYPVIVLHCAKNTQRATCTI